MSASIHPVRSRTQTQASATSNGASRALAPDEIKRLYNMGATTKFNVSKKQDPSLNQGLVGLWTFDAPDMAGVAAYDRSGQGNNGTLTNGPTRQIGKIGQALNFDGVNDYIDLGNQSQFQVQNYFSFGAWAKSNKNSAYQTVMSNLSTQVNGSTVGYKLEKDNSNKFTCYIDNSDVGEPNYAQVSSNNSYTDANWHHVICVSNNKTLTMYVDGQLQSGSAAYSTTIEYSTNLRIGAYQEFVAGGTLSNYFSGSIDEVRVYNRALAPDEIRRLYNMGR